MHVASCSNFARTLCGPACCSGLIQQKPVMYIFDSDYFTVFRVINVRTGCLDSRPFKTDWVRRLHLFYEELLTSSCFPSTFLPVKSAKQVFFQHSTTLTMLLLKEKKIGQLMNRLPWEKMNKWARRYWNLLHLFMTTDMKNDQILLLLFVFLLSCMLYIRLFSLFCL